MFRWHTEQNVCSRAPLVLYRLPSHKAQTPSKLSKHHPPKPQTQSPLQSHTPKPEPERNLKLGDEVPGASSAALACEANTLQGFHERKKGPGSCGLWVYWGLGLRAWGLQGFGFRVQGFELRQGFLGLKAKVVGLKLAWEASIFYM